MRDITQRMSDIERFNRNSSPECKDEDQTEKEEKSDCEDDAKTRTSEDSDSDYEIVDKTPKETCLKLIYPDLYEDDYEELRMLEKLAAIFIQTLGIRGAQRIGPTAFRTFSRSVHSHTFIAGHSKCFKNLVTKIYIFPLSLKYVSFP